MKKILLLGAMALSMGFSAVADTPEFPSTEAWYQIKNQQGGGIRDNSYLGYYPETEWTIIPATGGSEKVTATSEWLCPAAPFEEGSSEAVKDGQLWRLIANEAGDKYCLVNKAFPDGAISNESLNNASANNASRWGYVADRTATPDQVEWFTLSNEFGTEGGNPISALTFTNPANADYCYMGFAAAGQQFQFMRYNSTSEAGCQWEFIYDSAYEGSSSSTTESITLVLNTGNCTGSDGINGSNYFFNTITSNTDPVVVMTMNNTANSGCDTRNNRFNFRAQSNAQNQPIYFSIDKEGYYISAITFNTQDDDNGAIWMKFGADGDKIVLTNSPKDYTAEYEYTEGVNPVIYYGVNSSGTKYMRTNSITVVVSAIPSDPVIDYTPVTKALETKAAILEVVAESVPGSEESVAAFIAKYAEMTPEAIVEAAGGTVAAAVAAINAEYDKFIADTEAAIPTWVNGKQVLLQNVRRASLDQASYAAAVQAEDDSFTFNTIAEPDQTAVWKFIYGEGTECTLYNVYAGAYAAPMEGTDGNNSDPVENDAYAVAITLTIAADGHLLLKTDESYPYLCFDTRGNRMAYWNYDAGCDWIASFTDIEVTPWVGISAVEATAEVNETIYDLQGRRLYGIPARGLYIVNGRKQLVK